MCFHIDKALTTKISQAISIPATGDPGMFTQKGMILQIKGRYLQVVLVKAYFEDVQLFCAVVALVVRKDTIPNQPKKKKSRCLLAR